MATNYRNFSIPDYSDVQIVRTHMVFERTDSGKSWKKNPSVTDIRKITTEEYNNYVRSINFMNGFCGGSCRAEKGYTPCGYIPVKITLVNPSGTEKHTETYRFITIREKEGR